MARLDRLAPVKEVAQLAATIGRRFGLELLAAISSMTEDALRRALARLEGAGLIYHCGIGSEPTYEFRHALVQETAYESLLKSRRQSIHARIADVLSTRHPDLVETSPEMLAHHYSAAGMISEAVDFLGRSGKRAANRSAYREAAGHYGRALELLKALPDDEARLERELALRLGLAPALSVTKMWSAHEVLDTYLRARDLAARAGSPAQQFAANYGLFLSNLFIGQFRRAQDFARELPAMADKHSDNTLRLPALHSVWTIDLYRGHVSSCWEHAQQGIAIYDHAVHGATKSLGSHDSGVCAWSLGGRALWHLGYPDRALANVQEGVTLAERLDHPISVLHGLNMMASVRILRREPQAVAECVDRLLELAEEHGAPQSAVVGRVFRGWASAFGGNVEAGLAELREGIKGVRAAEVRVGFTALLHLGAEGCAHAGAFDEALALLDEAWELSEMTGERLIAAELQRLYGEIFVSSPRKDESKAETCLTKAIAIAQSQNAKSLELRAISGLAGLWHDQGRREEARNLLAPIHDWFTEGFGTADLKEAEVLLDELAGGA
jgi:predicted ATPase